MNRLSILIGLSGSLESQFAAELGWEIAKKTNAKVDALHVLDTDSTWRLLGCSTAGFIGSGMFISLCEDIQLKLASIGDKLSDKYESIADGMGIEGEVLIASGDPVEQLSRHALNHDIVIVGRQPQADTMVFPKRHAYFNYGVPEALVQCCQRPVLVCTEQHTAWTKVRIVLAVDHPDFNYVHSALQFANILGITPSVVCLSPDLEDGRISKLKENLKEMDESLSQIEVKIETVPSAILKKGKILWSGETSEIFSHHETDQLTIVPTRKVGDECCTILNTCPSEMIRSLALSNMMFWPEEY